MGETGKNDVVRPHDRLVRNVLGNADLVADLLRNYLDPEKVRHLHVRAGWSKCPSPDLARGEAGKPPRLLYPGIAHTLSTIRTGREFTIPS